MSAERELAELRGFDTLDGIDPRIKIAEWQKEKLFHDTLQKNAELLEKVSELERQVSAWETAYKNLLIERGQYPSNPFNYKP